jgi:hypothetical protein
VFLLPPSIRDWLPDDHLVWFVIEAVGRLDTAAFHTRARLGGVGRRGFDPDMLLCLFGVPPTFRTVEPIGSIPERRAVGGEKVSEILA